MVVALVVVCFVGCSRRKNDSPPPPPAAVVPPPPATAEVVRSTEEAAAQRDTEEAECKGRVPLYDGSINVDASGDVQPVEHGDAWGR